MAILAIFISIIILQNLVPFLGNIPIGPLSITLIHITVITAAIVLGPKDGMLIGAIWGLITWIRAFVWPTSPIAVICFTNPLISVLPRILVGATSGYSYLKLKNKINNKLSMVIAAAIGSMTNTLLVLGQIYIFYHNQAPKLYSVNVKELLPYLLGVVGTNGIPEMLAAMFLVPIISTILIKIVWKK
ncbi:ECF transporter S component [Ligilactobacillus cholophilus]|uniref:ECF transporter S component n=1 Tax=Ligilactobacillus cholophilus TaxID=3050131 RepID=UPI0025B279A0|nr:ECF transporter S component [Ligilactobacillus cholophilus]